MAAALAVNNVSAIWKEGYCPYHGQNKENFDLEAFAGRWYEYVWDEPFDSGYAYHCSRWMIENDFNCDDHHDLSASSATNDLVHLREGIDASIKFKMMWEHEKDDK